MKTKRKNFRAIALAGLTAVLALCILSDASSAQSKDDRKDRTGGDRKREEPKREERSEREPSRDRTVDRNPARETTDRPARDSGDRTSRETTDRPVRDSGDRTSRETTDRPARDSGDRTSRERPGRSERTDRDRPGSGGRESGRDGGSSGVTGSDGKRTPPDRSIPDDTTLPKRPRPPRRPGIGDYDRSRDDGIAGTRPGDRDPRIRPPRRRRPFPDTVRRKEVPIPEERIRIIVEGWPYPPPWYPVFVRRYIEDPAFLYNKYLIHLPFGTIEPRTVDEEFLILLNELYYEGMQEAQLVCIVQTYRSMDVDLFELFFDPDEEVTVYGAFTRNSFLVLIPVYSVFELLDDPRIRWVGEYKPYYKINDDVKLWEWDGALVFSLEGDSSEFRDDLLEAGLPPDFYDEEVGYYFVPAESYELERLASFWWVAEVLEVVSDPALVYGYDNVKY
jgi:hypothetical protein